MASATVQCDDVASAELHAAGEQHDTAHRRIGRIACDVHGATHVLHVDGLPEHEQQLYGHIGQGRDGDLLGRGFDTCRNGGTCIDHDRLAASTHDTLHKPTANAESDPGSRIDYNALDTVDIDFPADADRIRSSR